MTELETIKRAKMYIDYLAKGINPLNGQTINDNDIINNVRISRCLYFVGDILQNVIDNGGTKNNKKKEKKIPFSISENKKAHFDFSSSPISISEIAYRLNVLRESENMIKLQARHFNIWLISLGLLEEIVNEEGNIRKRPTQIGIDIGISVEERSNPYRIYHVVVYNNEAQHFIVDNINAMLDFNKSNFSLQGRPWKLEHEKYLINAINQNTPIKEICLYLKRDENAVKRRARQLGLIP